MNTHSRRFALPAAVTALLAGTLAVAAPAQAASSTVTDIAALQTAASACTTGDVVTIGADITSANAVVTTGCSMTLDLGDKRLSLSQVVIKTGTTLTIRGGAAASGSLTARSSRGAAIRTTGANLVISSGTVNASTVEDIDGFARSAAIGSDGSGLAGNVTIAGGTVTATSNTYGSGIGGGGGSGGNGGTTTITGGTVTATGGVFASGIGSGANPSGAQTGGTVTITGGTVRATGRVGGAGIGGGIRSAGATVTIGTGADVTAAGGARQNGGGPVSAIGAGDGYGQTWDFGTLSVAGTLRIPAGSNLTIPTGSRADVTSTGVITGATGADDGGRLVGPGTFANGGSIRLPSDQVVDATTPAVVSDHHYAVTFDTQGGSTAPSPVKVFAASFTAGGRAFPANPTKAGLVFTRWNTEADGSGIDVAADSTLPGSAALAAVPVTVHAQFVDPPAAGDTRTVDGITYTVNADAATVTATSYDGTTQGTDVVIPKTISWQGTDYPVTAVADFAFGGSDLTSLVVGSNVRTIGQAAFSNGALTTLTIPDSVTTIGDSAFFGHALTSLTLGQGLTTIGESAFRSNKLTTVVIPDSVTSTGAETFRDNALTSVTIGSGLKRLSYAMFVENDLTSVTIPDTVTELGGFAFSTNALTSVVFGTGLKTIGEAAFGTNQLTKIVLPEGLETIGDSAFQENPLATVDFPSTLTAIGDAAFAENELTTVDIPDSVTSIGTIAFFRNGITTVTLGAGLKTIGSNAFSFNEISGLVIPDSVTSIGVSAFENNRSDSLTIGTGLTSIPDDAFRSFGLTSLTIPATVTSIGKGAFASNGLTTVTFLGAAPSIEPAGTDGSFGESFNAFTLQYQPQFGQPLVQDGFTTPTWQGYRSIVAGSQNPTNPSNPTQPANPTQPPAAGPDQSAAKLAPSIGGNAREGRTLRASTGLPVGTAATYRWKADGRTIKGATGVTLKLGKKQAARRITVTVTSGGRTVTSKATKVVASRKARLVVTPTRIGKRDFFRVTAVGLRKNQEIRVWLGGRRVVVGTADVRGVVDRKVRFSARTDAGKRRVRVSGYAENGTRTYTIKRTVRYLSR